MFNNAGVACTHHPFPSPFVSIAIRVRSFGGIDADIMPIIAFASEKIRLCIHIRARPIVDWRRFDS